MQASDLLRLRAWHDTLDQSSYYEVLGVLEIADGDALREAFHQLSLSFHPDSHQDADADVRAMATRVFQRGAEAYRVLTDPELRVSYDMALARGELRLVRRTSTHPPPAAEQRPLHELCRSAGAKLAAQRADKLLARGELAKAKAELLVALDYDGGANPALGERLEAVQVALYAQGD